MLQKLPERERKIIQLRYGLKDGRYRTLEEVGVEFGITRERIRQIEARICASCATRTTAAAARLPRITELRVQVQSQKFGASIKI